MDADRKVGATDGSRPQADGRAPSQLAMGLGHERGRALVTGRDDADAGGFERIEQTEEGLTGHREGIADTGRAQRIGDEPTDRSLTRRRRRLGLRRLRGGLGDTASRFGSGGGRLCRSRGVRIGLRDGFCRRLEFGLWLRARGLGRGLSP